MAPDRSISGIDRRAALRELARPTFDVLVIGGGIAGACAAWDATLRGLRVALVERGDFASSTSAHSLKILHGGIRYLQHLDFARVRATCAERAAFLRIAPHLTQPLAFAVPTYGRGMQSKWALRSAFMLNELLTLDRNRDIDDPVQRIPRPYMLSRHEFMAAMPMFAQPGLTGAGVFYDGQVRNPPRLVYSIVRSAQEAGCVAVNYCAAERLLARDGRIEGARMLDQATGDTFDVRARVVANMAGPGAPLLAPAANESERMRVPMTRDLALVVNRRILPGMGVAVQTRYRDPGALLSRGNIHLFMAPWREKFTLIGVNSRLHQGDPNTLVVTEAEIDDFIAQINEAVPALQLQRADIGVVNAGLLPTGENAPGQRDINFGKRSPLIDHADGGGPQGLITGMSVLLTMGRALAQSVVDLAMRKLGQPVGQCRTAFTPVWRSSFDQPIEMSRGIALPDSEVTAERVEHVVRDEMVVTLADLMLRRLDLGTAQAPSDALVAACGRIVASRLGWDRERERREIERVRASYPFSGPGSQSLLPPSQVFRSAS